jgi:septum formation protein
MNALLTVTAPFILASQSPRRRALLEQLGLSFRVEKSPASEHVDEAMPPAETARSLADRKARPVATAHPSALVLAADTIVAHDGAILEKPETPEHAHNMLRRLSGGTHTVYTGLALHHAETDRAVVTGQATEVTLSALDDADIEAYVATGSPMDKAGGYGIQDHTAPLFIDHLDGDYYNVVGLPLRRLYLTLRADFSGLLDS